MAHPKTIVGKPFYGADTSIDQCEILAVQNIHRSLIGKEAGLFKLKWFDYRGMHPTMATYLATHFYNQAYGFFMATCMDRKKRFMVGFKGKDFMASREKQSFWKMRQKADEIGARYDFFMIEAMKWCMDNGWLHPPRPAMIATNADMQIYIANQWENECRSKIQWAVDDRYRSEMYVGTPDQQAYEDFVASRIMMKSHPKYAINSALYLFDAIRIEEAIRRFPLQAVVDAIDISSKKISHD